MEGARVVVGLELDRLVETQEGGQGALAEPAGAGQEELRVIPDPSALTATPLA